MSASTDAAEINIGYLRRADPKSTLSLIEMPATNDGVAGARLAVDDNKKTRGGFDQQVSLADVRLVGGGAAVAPAPAPSGARGPPVIVSLPGRPPPPASPPAA